MSQTAAASIKRRIQIFHACETAVSEYLRLEDFQSPDTYLRVKAAADYFKNQRDELPVKFDVLTELLCNLGYSVEGQMDKAFGGLSGVRGRESEELQSVMTKLDERAEDILESMIEYWEWA